MKTCFFLFVKYSISATIQQRVHKVLDRIDHTTYFETKTYCFLILMLSRFNIKEKNVFHLFPVRRALTYFVCLLDRFHIPFTGKTLRALSQHLYKNITTRFITILILEWHIEVIKKLVFLERTCRNPPCSSNSISSFRG